MQGNDNYDSALYGVSDRIKDVLIRVSRSIKQETEEIRLRLGLPLALTVSGDTAFVKESGEVVFSNSSDLFFVSEKDISESFLNLTQNSVYAHEEELKNGFIIMKNGCRAGVCGTLSLEGFLSDVTSVNLRIAREVIGCADELMKKYTGGGLLIAGPAGSGKTTILRDIIRQLSFGKTEKPKRVCVIDSRGEISGSQTNRINNLGPCTDILYIDNKAKGIEIALRTMFAQIIAFDEIANSEELKKVKEGFFSGVDIITTTHIGSVEELLKRNVTATLIKERTVSFVAVLPKRRGDKIEFFNVSELL